MKAVLISLYAAVLATAAGTAYSFYADPSADVQSEAVTCVRMQADAQFRTPEQQAAANAFCNRQRAHRQAVRKAFSG